MNATCAVIVICIATASAMTNKRKDKKVYCRCCKKRVHIKYGFTGKKWCDMKNCEL
jgi:hypothetical protein